MGSLCIRVDNSVMTTWWPKWDRATIHGTGRRYKDCPWAHTLKGERYGTDVIFNPCDGCGKRSAIDSAGALQLCKNCFVYHGSIEGLADHFNLD